MNKNIALLALTGILTLASCGQNTGGSTTNPVTTYSLGITVSGANGTVTVKNANGVSVGTVTGSGTVTGLANGTYTLTASDVSGFTTPSTQTVTINGANANATVTYTATGPGTGNGGNTTPAAFTLNITSPSNGAEVKVGTPVQVTFSSSVALKSATCRIGSGAEAAATVSTSGGFCTVTPTAAGSNVITVTGVNEAGTTVTTSVAVNAAPNSTSGTVVPAADQELTLTNEGIVRDLDSGWRYIGQGVSTPTDPDTNIDLYVKGTVNFTVNGTAGQKVEVILARTTGSDVPTNDQIQAGDVLLSRVSTSGTETFAFDSTRLAEFEAVREWFVVRVNGTQVSYQPVIADNKAPQSADPMFNGVTNGYSNLLRNYNGNNINFARGDIRLYTTNPSLQDREYGQAPVGASFAQRRPAGFESIRYFLVPETAFDNKGLQDSDEKRRAQTIKQVATVRSAPVLEPGSDRAAAFGSLIGSGSQTTVTAGQRAADNVNYRIYTVVRDQLGNEAASAGYETIRFDNVGPSIGDSGLRDVSALPFPSQDPTACLSDIAAVNLSNFADNSGGIGLNGNAAFNLGGITLINGQQFDTNRLADGTYPLNYSNVTDALGNLPINSANTTVTIDNTDPTVSFNRPQQQAPVNSGERVTVESSATDDGCGVYEARLFWDSNTTRATDDDTTTAAIGHPVQFARKTNTDAANSRAMSLNQGWNALQLPNTTGPVQLRALVIDRAGNATIVSTPITVRAKTGRLPSDSDQTVTINANRPVLGNSDAYLRSVNPLLSPTSNVIAPVGTNGTVISANFSGNSRVDNNLTLDATGTYTTNGSFTQTLPTPTPNLNEQINAALAYGRFDATRWAQIRNYQLVTDPTLTTKNDGDLRTFRTSNWNVRTPWVALGDSATPDNKQQFTFTSDLLNDFYNGRTFNNIGSDNDNIVNDGVLPNARVSYDEFNGVVTDTAGSYSFFGEKIQK